MSRFIPKSLLVIPAALLLTSGAASAAGPAAADIAACNQKAQSEVETASASPGRQQRPQREPQEVPGARGGVLAGSRSVTPDAPVPAGRERAPAADPTGRTLTPSADPQLEGMDTEGAKDPAYIAAYKRCMRQRGF